MKEELISFNTASLAKEKGFDEPVYAIYSGNQLGIFTENDKIFNKWNHCKDKTYSAPSQSLLQKWLRDEHDIHIDNLTEWVQEEDDIPVRIEYWWNISFPDEKLGYDDISSVTGENRIYLEPRWYNSYEESLEEALYEALTLIKN